jgi:hypothetical protein
VADGSRPGAQNVKPEALESLFLPLMQTRRALLVRIAASAEIATLPNEIERHIAHLIWSVQLRIHIHGSDPIAKRRHREEHGNHFHHSESQVKHGVVVERDYQIPLL